MQNSNATFGSTMGFGNMSAPFQVTPTPVTGVDFQSSNIMSTSSTQGGVSIIGYLSQKDSAFSRELKQSVLKQEIDNLVATGKIKAGVAIKSLDENGKERVTKNGAPVTTIPTYVKDSKGVPTTNIRASAPLLRSADYELYKALMQDPTKYEYKCDNASLKASIFAVQVEGEFGSHIKSNRGGLAGTTGSTQTATGMTVTTCFINVREISSINERLIQVTNFGSIPVMVDGAVVGNVSSVKEETTSATGKTATKITIYYFDAINEGIFKTLGELSSISHKAIPSASLAKYTNEPEKNVTVSQIKNADKVIASHGKDIISRVSTRKRLEKTNNAAIDDNNKNKEKYSPAEIVAKLNISGVTEEVIKSVIDDAKTAGSNTRGAENAKDKLLAYKQSLAQKA